MKVIEKFVLFFFFLKIQKKLRSFCECRCRTDICEQDSQTFGGGADHGTRHDPLCPRIASGKRRENSGRCHQEEGWMLCCVSCVVGVLCGDLSFYHFFVTVGDLCCVSCVVGSLSGDLSFYHFFVD